jgi:FAD/FMN-containing dehydrogenase
MAGAQDPWQNWSGAQRHQARLLTPASVEEVARLVHEATDAGATGAAALRCVGSGHSFVPFWSDGIIVSLDGLSGVQAVDVERGRATVAAGTKLYDLGPALWEHGLSLPQQGDIDRQSLAGALATGTHGTGRRVPNLSSYLCGVTLVDGTGEVRVLTPEADPDAFRAVRVSQGLLGVVVSITLSLLPAFHLRERLWQCSVAECEADIAGLIDGNRHFEFFWTPRTDLCDMKTLNPAAAPGAPPDALPEGERAGPAYQIFPSQRDVRFNEMEYSVPFEAGWECFTELRAMMLARFPSLPWPVEYRTLAADSAMLSTAHHRDSVTLSVHQGAERDFRPLFDACEAVFRNHGGRPHWGKLHSLGAADLEALYPEFDRFRAVRRQFDPKGLFLNDYLARLFAA